MKKVKLKIVLILFSIVFLFITQEGVGMPGRYSKKYTFVLVHGSWHGDWAWYLTQKGLESKGHRVCTVNLPGHGVDQTDRRDITLQSYEDAVIDVLDEIQEKVILVGHSFGGVVISSVAEKRPEKIEKLVYLSAFLLQDGQAAIDISVQDANSLIFPNIIIDEEANEVPFVEDADLESIFYQYSNEESIILAEKLLTPEPYLPLVTPIQTTDENFGSIKKYYIQTLEDKAISPEIQKLMFTETPCDGVYCIISDHSPFFSDRLNAQLEELLLKIAGTHNKGRQSSLSLASDESVKVYPQPFQSSFNVQVPSVEGKVTISLYSDAGNKLLEEVHTGNVAEVKIAAPSDESSAYILVVSGEDLYYSQRILRD